MLALLYALFIVGGKATYEELRILLEHADLKGVRAAVARAETDGFVSRPGVRGGLIALTRNGVACVAQKLADPVVHARMEEARTRHQAAADAR